MGVAAIKGVYNGKVKIADKQPLQHYRLSLDGRGRQGFIRGSGTIDLEEKEGQTLLKYAGDIQVGGLLASVGQRMLDTVSKSLTRQSLEAMNNALEARLATEVGEEPAEAYTAPTQAEFAREVAKDVAAETFKSNKTIWIVAAVVIVIIVVVLLMI